MHILALSLLAVPGWHQVHSHSAHLRLLRLVRPGTAVSVTPHERRHAQLSGYQRSMANATWLFFSFAVIFFALG